MNSVYILRTADRYIVGVYQTRKAAEVARLFAFEKGECSRYTSLHGDIIFTWSIEWFPVGT